MSDPTQPIAPPKLSLEQMSAIVRVEQNLPKPRSTLRFTSAVRFLPYIREIVVTGNPVVVPVTIIQKSRPSADTLYIALIDAWRWFIDHDPNIDEAERKVIAWTRSQVRFDRSNKEQITMFLKMTMCSATYTQGPAAAEVIKAGEARQVEEQKRGITMLKDTTNWRRDLVEWLQSGPSGSVFSQKIHLERDDRVWVENMLNGMPDVEVSISDTSVTIAKG